MNTATVQMRRKGVITLPVALRNRYSLDEGDVFTLADLGDGSFLLIPRISQTARLGDRVADMMRDEQVDPAEVLQALEEERERYYQEHYVRPASLS